MNDLMQSLLVFPFPDRWFVLLLLYSIIVVVCLQRSKTDRRELHVYAGQMIDFAVSDLGEAYLVFCGLCI